MDTELVISLYCLASICSTLVLKKLKPLIKGSTIFGWCQGTIFVLFSCYRIFKTPAVLDELSFIKIAEKNGNHSNPIWSTLFSPNLESFGGIWWTLESLSHKFWVILSFEKADINTIITLRLFSVMLLSIFIGMLAKSVWKRMDLILFLPLIVGTLPMSWWSGKLASPELPAACLLGLGVLLYLNYKTNLAGLVLGFAIGFKFSAAPAVLGFLVYISWNYKEDSIRKMIRKISTVFLGALVGFLLCNLYLFKDPKSFLGFANRLNPLVGEVPEQGNPIRRIYEILFHTGMHWDFVSNSGVLYWVGGPIAALGFLAILIMFKEKKVIVTSLVAFVITGVALNLNGGNLYPWYYFPDICLTAALASQLPCGAQVVSAINIRRLTYTVAALSVSASSITAAGELELGSLDIRDYNELPSQLDCINRSLSEIPRGTKIFNVVKSTQPLPLNRITNEASDISEWISTSHSEMGIFVTGGRGRMSLNYLTDIRVKKRTSCGPFMIYEIWRK